MMTDSCSANADQVDYWNGEAGQKWTLLQDDLDRLFADLTGVTLDHAAPRPGQAVVDVGCGCGATSLALGERVGAAGRVLGLDISAPMLVRARERAAGLPQIELILADASRHELAPASFDLVFSRFGVMFFDNPDEAFANLRRSLTSDGRLCFVCWRPLEESSWMHAPLSAVQEALPPIERPAPDEPGPFAFRDPQRVSGILARAGFVDPSFRPLDITLHLGDLEHALTLTTQMGPAGRALAAAPPERRAAAVDALRRQLLRHRVDGEVRLGAAVWLVSAGV